MDTVKALSGDDKRLTVPLFMPTEAAHYLAVPPNTLRNWVKGYDFPTKQGTSHSEPIVLSLNGNQRHVRLPFIGLAQALVIDAFRRRKIHMRTIRAALDAIEREIGVEYAIANGRVYTAGASILLDYARSSSDDEIGRDIHALVEPASGQAVFVESVRQYLERISYGKDLWPERVYLPRFQSKVVVDMQRGFAQPMLDKSRIRVMDIADRFYLGGERPEEIAADLEIDEDDVLDVVRHVWQRPQLPAAA